MTSRIKALAFLVFLATIGTVCGFYFGRRTAPRPPDKWYSEVHRDVYGSKQPLFNMEITCPNGKKLGRIQLDLNLKNGQWRVVRNDPGEYPTCD